MNVATVTPPAFEPVDLATARAHLRQDDGLTAEDGLIQAYIKAAAEQVETDTHRFLATRTVSFAPRLRPGGCLAQVIRLPGGVVSAVDSVQYHDGTGYQTLDAADYQTDLDEIPPVIAHLPGAAWPAIEADRLRPFKIQYQVGYPEGAIPDSLVQACLLLIGHFFEHREAVTSGKRIEATPLAYDRLVLPHRLLDFSP